MTVMNVRNYEYYSNMRMCIVIIPKIGGTLSIICSAFVAQDVLKLLERYAKMINNVIFALSISGIILLISCPISGMLPLRKGLVYVSSVNQGTCTSQGYSIMFSGLCAALYNMTLALTYLFQVLYEWSEEKLRRYQPSFIFIPIFVGLILATSLSPYSVYNFNGGWVCEIAASPLRCNVKDSCVDCIRRANTKNLRFFIVAILLILISVAAIRCMIILYRTVLIQERNIYRFNISGYQNSFLSKRVAIQGIYFSGAYFLTWIFCYVYMVINTLFDAQPNWL